jgi:ribonuclease BN (tRNA processing enzyme)
MASEAREPVHIFLTHLHLDHLQGLGFFRPLFQKDREIHIWGPSSPVQSLADRIATYLSPPLFPVRLGDIPARLIFHDAPEEPVQLGGVLVSAAPVAHQGPTVGYRIEERGHVLVYLPDHEPGLGGGLSDRPLNWLSGYDLARKADVLLHDAQYGDDEYRDHVGWGHSAIGHVVEFARKAEVAHLVLFHHDPYHADHDLELLARAARELGDSEPLAVSCAWEGMSIEFGAFGVSVEPVWTVGPT